MARPQTLVLLSAVGIVIVLAAAGFSGLLELAGFGDGDGKVAGGEVEGGEDDGPAKVREEMGEEVPEDAAATEPEKPAPPPPPWSERPMTIAIRGREYFAGGQVQTLDALIDMVGKIPAGTGPAVVLTRAETSRASAEESLKRLLQERKIEFEWRD
jgi:hypothetical protein